MTTVVSRRPQYYKPCCTCLLHASIRALLSSSHSLPFPPVKLLMLLVTLLHSLFCPLSLSSFLLFVFLCLSHSLRSAPASLMAWSSLPAMFSLLLYSSDGSLCLIYNKNLPLNDTMELSCLILYKRW